MTDSFATAPGSMGSGERAISRLADRIASMAPPPSVLELSDPKPAPARPSPAVSAALARTATLTAAAEQRARNPRRRSLLVATVEGFVTACAFIPYALVALALRLIMARVFFLDGQTLVDGPRYAYRLHGFDFSVILPLQVKAEAIAAIASLHGALPPALTAYLLSGAEFLLPIMLVIGFGTRFAAFGLILVTALIQVFVLPAALWTTHIYWAAILLVLLSRGPGEISFDQIFRSLTRRRS